MKLINYFIVLVSLMATSCLKSGNSNGSEKNDNSRFREFIGKLQLLPVGYKYDLMSQDSERCYQVVKADSSYFSEYTWIAGYLPDTSRYYSILYLKPGDDLYPSLRVFSKSGEAISSEAVSYADCAAGDCGVKECVSVVEVVDKYSVERSLTMSYATCDSLGKEISELHEVKKRQMIGIDDKGRIKFGEMK